MIKLTKEELKLYYYDAKAGESPCKFVEAFCCHGAGELKGQPIVLMDWQKDLLRSIFGIKKLKDDKRRYKKAYIEIPKKNAKTTLSTAIMLYCFFILKHDKIYFGAAARDQAKIAFDMAKYMVENSPRLNKLTECFTNTIVVKKTGAVMHVIASLAKSQDGKIVSAAVIDEIHRHENRGLYDVLTKGVATATDPLIIIITTAGAGQEGIGWDMSKKAKAIRDGITKDDTMFVAIYAADPKDDPFSIETLKKANPGYGVIVQEDFLLDQANDAKNNPSEFASYQRFHLDFYT